MSLLDRYQQLATPLGQDLPRHRVLSDWVHPDIEELMGIEQVQWPTRMRQVRSSGDPIAGPGFAAPIPPPNTELVSPPTAITGVTTETNLYTPSSTASNSAWSLIPIGTLRGGQRLRIEACGVITSSAASQTCAFTSRIGTSSTPSSNQSLGATGAIGLGSTITNALWWYEGMATVQAVGPSAKIVSWANIQISQQAAGSATTANTGLSGNTTATFDSTIQQGFVISITPSATGVSAQIVQFLLAAWD